MARTTDGLRRLTFAASAVALAGLAIAGSAPAANDEFATCGAAHATADHVACLTRAVVRIERTEGLDRAVARLDRAARSDQRIAVDCHMAMHPVGEVDGRLRAERGAALPLRQPSSFCHEGYVHGMQVAWLDAAPTMELVRGGARACDASDSTIDWACGHSFGHVLARHAGDRGMRTAMRWCATAYEGAVHLGLDRDSWLTTCAKGALMEYTLRDATTDAIDLRAGDCSGVRADLAMYCEAHVWLRAGLGTGRVATDSALLDTCDRLATTRAGRLACAGLVGRGVKSAATCDAAVVDLRRACREGHARAPASIAPAAVPAGFNE